MLVLRSLLFNLLFYLVLIVMLVIGIPLMLTSQQTIKNYARLWGRIALCLLKTICHVHLDYRGLEHVPRSGYILAAKHQSFLDVIVLLPLAPHFVYVMKQELGWIPLFGQLMVRGGMIPIDRSKGRAVMATLSRKVKEAVAAGRQLIIFPEGTRRPPGAEPVYKSGVAHLYVAVGAPCLPVALNSGVFWPRRSFLRYPGTLVIDILEPIAPGLDKAVFQAELQDRIESSTNRLLDEFRTGAGNRG